MTLSNYANNNQTGVAISQLPLAPVTPDLTPGVIAISYNGVTYSISLVELASQIKSKLGISSTVNAADVNGLSALVNGLINTALSAFAIDVSRVTGLDTYINAKLSNLTLDASAINGLNTLVTSLINSALVSYQVNVNSIVGLQTLVNDSIQTALSGYTTTASTITDFDTVVNSLINTALSTLTLTVSSISDFTSAVATAISNAAVTTDQVTNLTPFVQGLIDGSAQVNVTAAEW